VLRNDRTLGFKAPYGKMHQLNEQHILLFEENWELHVVLQSVSP